MMPRKQGRDGIAGQYRSAVAEYLEGRCEAALKRAYETGRAGLSNGLGILEMAAAHRDAAGRILRKAHASRREAAMDAAWECFTESLSPFEMVLRGVRESNAGLRRSVATLKTVTDALETERRRYQALFDLAPEAYVVTDADGTIREANRAAATLFESSNAELAGRPISMFVSEADRPGFIARLNSGEAERIVEWHVALRVGRGCEFPAVLTVAAEANAAEGPALRWLIRDATERKRREQERARSLVGQTKAQAAKRFEFLAEASSQLSEAAPIETRLRTVAWLAVPFLAQWCLVTLSGDDGKISALDVAYADRRAGRLAAELKKHCIYRDGVAETKAIARITAEWCDAAAGCAEHARLLEQFIGRSGMVVRMESADRWHGLLTFISAPGRRPYAETDLTLAKDLGRRCAMAVENARLYCEVMVERDRAKEASRAKDEFLAILSHELRNPLMPVIGWTRAFRNHALIAQDSTLSEGAKALERSARTLERLVEDCLDFTRISEGRIRMERQRVDLNEVVRECMEGVRDMASAQAIGLSCDPATGAVEAVGDRIRLEQVITNLLVNAVKYTPPGGSVSIACRREGPSVQVEVRDRGIGIDPRFLDRIFDPFRRGANSWLKHPSGLGLGLAVARRIVEQHGGRIRAESDGINRGAVFFIELPAAAASSTEPPAQNLVEAVRVRGNGARVLLIEDSKDIRFLLTYELERLGHSVFAAADGASGMERARRDRPDVLVSDIKMPGLNGYELIREIRANPEFRGIPAIALTGFGAKHDFERAMAAGFDACISKPADAEEISALIHTLVEQKQHHSLKGSRE